MLIKNALAADIERRGVSPEQKVRTHKNKFKKDTK
jgi:hypothetical protein